MQCDVFADSLLLRLPIEIWLSVVFFNWDENNNTRFFVWLYICKSMKEQFEQKALPRYFMGKTIVIETAQILLWPKRVLALIQGLALGTTGLAPDIALFTHMPNLRNLALSAKFYQSIFSGLTTIQSLALVDCDDLSWDVCEEKQQRIFPQLPSSLINLRISGLCSFNFSLTGVIDLQKYEHLGALTLIGNCTSLQYQFILPQNLTFLKINGIIAPLNVNPSVLKIFNIDYSVFNLNCNQMKFPCLESFTLIKQSGCSTKVQGDYSYTMLKHMVCLQDFNITSTAPGNHTFQSDSLVHLGLFCRNEKESVNIYLHHLPRLETISLQSLAIKLHFGSHALPCLKRIRLYDAVLHNVTSAFSHHMPNLHSILLCDSILITESFEWKYQILPIQSDHKMEYETFLSRRNGADFACMYEFWDVEKK